MLFITLKGHYFLYQQKNYVQSATVAQSILKGISVNTDIRSNAPKSKNPCIFGDPKLSVTHIQTRGGGEVMNSLSSHSEA